MFDTGSAKTWRGTERADHYNGGDDADAIYGLCGDDMLGGGGGDDLVDGGAGNDLVSGGAGADTLIGGDGIDAVSYALATGEVHIDLTAGYAKEFPFGTIDTLSGFEVAIGSRFDDSILGTAAGDDLRGGDGNDYIDGKGGDDILRGDAGADVLIGGDGFDYADYFYTQGVTVNLSAQVVFAQTVDAGRDELRGIEGIHGSRYADVITGNAGANHLLGWAGRDILNGGAGDDDLAGGDGADLLTGGLGRDVLYGGAQADRFIFRQNDTGSTLATADVIADFSRAEGDKINLLAIDANVGAAGNQTFAFIGDAAFSGKAGELRFASRGDYTVIEGDVNGDGAADGVIILNGAHTLVATDFVL